MVGVKRLDHTDGRSKHFYKSGNLKPVKQNNTNYIIKDNEML